jgi:hypothetical protein
MKLPSKNTDPKQDLFEMGYKRTICVDFDGVIHHYRNGWNGGDIYDEPVPGAFEWLAELVNHPEMEVAIYSSRSKTGAGIEAMEEWFLRRGLPQEVFDKLIFPNHKPAAWLTIDDRCFQFRGVYPNPKFLLAYQAWMKEPSYQDVLGDVELLRGIAEEHVSSNSGVYSRLHRIADRLEGRAGSEAT